MPRDSISPVCTLKFVLRGSGVSALRCVRSNTDSATRLFEPGGWYLMPNSYCSPLVGLNGVLSMLTPLCGRNDVE
ncbi:hypothetical protein D3C72_1959850 [compost metagenome]